MARPWRIEFEGAYYHVLSRGNERRNISLDDKDRVMFLDIVGEASERFEVEVFAFVLMTTHYHILIRTNRPNLSKTIQWLGVTYTRKFNNSHLGSGHRTLQEHSGGERGLCGGAFLLPPQESPEGETGRASH